MEKIDYLKEIHINSMQLHICKNFKRADDRGIMIQTTTGLFVNVPRQKKTDVKLMSSMAGCWDLYLIIEAYLRKKIQQKYDLKTQYPL